MRWDVTGADSTTGQERSVIVDAPTKERAVAAAVKNGILVSSCAAQVTDEPPSTIVHPNSVIQRVSLARRGQALLQKIRGVRPKTVASVGKRHPIIAAIIMMILGWYSYKVMAWAVSPRQGEYMTELSTGDLSIAIRGVENIGGQAFVMVCVDNHSFDKKLSLDFEKIVVRDDSGNEYRHLKNSPREKELWEPYSIYPGYHVQHPLPIERVLEKDLSIEFRTGFSPGVRAVFSVPYDCIEDNKGGSLDMPINWSGENLANVGYAGTASLVFHKTDKGIEVTGKLQYSLQPLRSRYYRLYLYDQDLHVLESSPTIGNVAALDFLFFHKRVSDAVKFRLDWKEF
jgi:hypothetical protein